MAAKFDVYREHRTEYAARPQPRLVTIAPARYLAIAGQGAPGGQAFSRAIPALYSVAYTIKMADKAQDRDFKIGALEGLWWTPSGTFDYREVPAAHWLWKLMLRVPDFVTGSELHFAKETLRKKRKLGAADQVDLEIIEEGLCVQAMHVGSYADEPRTLAAMESMMAARGLHHKGPHHEIYLSNPMRVPVERIKTILRVPVC